MAGVIVLAGACSGGLPAPSALDRAGPDPARRTAVLQASWTPYQLPGALSGATAVAWHGRLLIAGGVTSSGTPTGAAAVLNPVTGQDRPDGTLARPVGDAGAAMVRGRLVLFGGRSGPDGGQHGARGGQNGGLRGGPDGQNGGHAIPGVQTLAGSGAAVITARLPAARSGLAVATAGQTIYLAGGAGRAGPLASVLKTTDAVHYSTVATLPVPVSDAGAVTWAGRLWVFGGRTPSGPTSAIQTVDLRTGHAKVAGQLPVPLAAESAFTLGGRIYLAGGLTSPRGGHHGAPPQASGTVLNVDPASGAVTVAGQLPMPIASAASAVLNGTAYLIGGTDGSQAWPVVVAIRPVPARTALPGTAGASSKLAPWAAPVSGPGHLAPGSDPAALPADVLVADHLNNRLVIIDPQGRIRWLFPRPGDLAPGQTFRVPDDAFFSPDGRYIVATQEDDQVISVINVAEHKITYRYGKPGAPGSGPGRLDNPDDAMMMPGGDLVAADIKNCRIIVIAPPAHQLVRVIGQGSNGCYHDPPRSFGSPNGAFPLTDGGYLVTEINGDWADSIGLTGHVRWSVNPPGVYYPSDTNEVYPGRYLTADYTDPGQVVEFSRTGRLLWRFGGLNQPSLALPMPNGDILVNDDFNHRIIVIDPAKNRIVWQYGHTGKPGQAPGYLNDPDGVDLVPPDSFLIRHASTMGAPKSR